MEELKYSIARKEGQSSSNLIDFLGKATPCDQNPHPSPPPPPPKKYRILTFRNKTESYLNVLQQNNAEAG